MLVKRCLILMALVLVLCINGFSTYVQRIPADATASVPALDSFHEVIHKIWHEAWPKKDTATLRQLVPDVQKGIAAVASAQLPGILKEKKAAWEEGVKRLENAGLEYRTAAETKDDSRLLAAAEKLHSQFEKLMLTVRPAMSELDEFHAVLYMLYHHYLPENDLGNIRASAIKLKEKMIALNSAKLPERMKQKEPEFQAARAKLSASVDEFAASVQTMVERKIKDSANTLHSNYQALEKILE